MRDRSGVLRMVVFACLMGSSCAAPGPPATNESSRFEGFSLEQTRNLLLAYNREVLSSTIHFDRPSVLCAIGEERPTAQLLELFKERDPVIEWLGGTAWAFVCREVGQEPFVDPLILRLQDSAPRNRSFACEALGLLGASEGSAARRAIPALSAMLEDDEFVPGYSGPPTVASFAASALAYMRRAEGVRVLLASAENREDWHLSYGHLFIGLSGENFGTDLEAWKSWFAENERP